MGEAERTQQKIKEKEDYWNALSIRIKAIYDELSYTLDEEKKVLLEQRLTDRQQKRKEVETELKKLESDWQPSAEFVEIPFVVVAMTNKQANELLIEDIFSHQTVAPIEKSQFQSFRQNLIQDNLNQLPYSYHALQENWHPDDQSEESIKEIILDSADNVNKDAVNHLPIQPRFFSTDFFATARNTYLKTWYDLSWSGCVLIVDAISLFHPVIYRQLLHSELGANERIAVGTLLFTSLIHSKDIANQLIKQIVEQRMQRAFIRSAWYRDKLCHHQIENRRTFEYWILETLPKIATTVKIQKEQKRPYPSGLQKVRKKVEPLGLSQQIFNPGGQA